MEELKDYLNSELGKMSKGLVATPNSREDLESFAKANHGSMDILLMQMAINFGYKIAMENIAEIVELQSVHDGEQII